MHWPCGSGPLSCVTCCILWDAWDRIGRMEEVSTQCRNEHVHRRCIRSFALFFSQVRFEAERMPTKSVASRKPGAHGHMQGHVRTHEQAHEQAHARVLIYNRRAFSIFFLWPSAAFFECRHNQYSLMEPWLFVFCQFWPAFFFFILLPCFCHYFPLCRTLTPSEN